MIHITVGSALAHIFLGYYEVLAALNVVLKGLWAHHVKGLLVGETLEIALWALVFSKTLERHVFVQVCVESLEVYRFCFEVEGRLQLQLGQVSKIDLFEEGMFLYLGCSSAGS